MKKITLIITAALFVLISFSSCRKCVDCTAYDRADNTAIYTQTYCGKKKIVDLNADIFVSAYTDINTHASCN